MASWTSHLCRAHDTQHTDWHTDRATLSVAINTCWKPVIDTSLCFWLYGVLATDLSDMPSVLYTFSALTVLVGRQEEHLAYKKVEWWFLVGSEVQIVCMWSSWAIASPHPTISYLILSQPGFTLLVPAYPACLGTEAVKRFYTVSQKKQDTKLLAITSPIIIRFSKFFHYQTL